MRTRATRHRIVVAVVLAGVVVLAGCAPVPGPPGPTPAPTDRIASNGSTQVCAVTDAGTVECWGTGWLGNAGATSRAQRLQATPVDGVSGAVAVGMGRDFSCALLDTGGVRCWGGNAQGQLGDGSNTTRPTPVDVVGIGDATGLALGTGGHACAVLDTGGVRCWGENGHGQLGDGTTTDRNAPVAVAGVTDAVQVAVGFAHSCALLADQTVRCWGAGVAYELGNQLPFDQRTPVQVVGLPPVTVISAGGDADLGGNPRGFTCGLSTDGSVWCWGKGGPTGSDPVGPRQTGPTGVVDVTGSCAITTGRDAFCSTNGGAWTPVDTGGDVVDIALLSPPGMCALVAGGGVNCTGTNDAGRLGNGFGEFVATPRPAVPGVSDVVELATGDVTTCARSSDGQVRCWGNSVFGQRGDGTTDYSPDATAPVLYDAVAIGAGEWSNCAVRASGAISCWGVGATPAQANTPTTVPGPTDVVALDGGQGSMCGLQAAGTVVCWGNNSSGQLGDGTTTPAATPVTVVGLTDAVELEVGYNHACARRAGGTVVCWGRNDAGALGDGTTTQRTTPVPVAGLTDATSLTAGFGTTCAGRSDATAWCWGNLDSLSPGWSPDPTLAAPVPGVSDVVGDVTLPATASGLGPLCWVGTGGTVRCTGPSGFHGLLGDGRVDVTAAGAQPTGLPAASTVSSGGAFTCAVAGGSVRCWGYDHDNELGDGGPTTQLVPGPVLGMP